MADTPTGGIVQCSWCPQLMADQHEVWYLHFATDHHFKGYSVRPIFGPDWNMAEITARTGR